MKERLPILAAWIGLVAVTVYAYAWITQLSFTSVDGWAGVVAARVEGPQDWWRVVSQPLTAGVAGYNANFWRPGFQLYQAIQRQLFGTHAGLWHAMDLGLHLVTCGALAVLARRLGLDKWGAFAAAAILALHPLGVEVVPATDRGSDMLVTLAACGTLLLALSRVPLSSAIGLFIALSFKEMAAILVPLSALLVWDQRDLKQGLLVGGVQAAVLAGWLALRGQVLDGLGGYKQGFFLPKGLGEPVRYAGVDMLLPGYSDLMDSAFGGDVAQVLVGVLLGGVVIAGAWRSRQDLSARAGFGLFFLGLVLLGVTSLYNRRLLYTPMAGLALLFATWLQDPGALRGFAVAALGIAFSTSPVVHRDQDWPVEAEAAELLTSDVVDQVRELPPGTTLWLVDRCIRVDGDKRRHVAWGRGKTCTYCIASYSLQAFYDDQIGPGHVQVERIAQRFLQAPLEPVTVEAREDGGVDVVRDTEGLRILKGARESWTIEKSPDALTLIPLERPVALVVAGHPEVLYFE